MNEERSEGGEWQSWVSAWQESQPSPSRPDPEKELAEQIAKVKKSSRRFGFGLVILTISEILFCIAAIVFMAYWLSIKPDPWRAGLFLVALVFLAIAMVFSIKNRRGTYRPRNETTQAFIELEWLRTQRQLRTLRFVIPGIAIELITVIALRIWHITGLPDAAERLPELLRFFGLYTLAILLIFGPAFWLWYRRIRQKQQELEPLRAAFADPDPGAPAQ